GVQGQLRLDERFSPCGLHVFSTSAGVQGLTGNPEGNGIYDRDVDAIFLDQSLFRPPQVAYLYADINVTKPRTDEPVLDGYLLFVFLHELGHRVLHRSSRRSGIEVEREADAFAVDVMERVNWSIIP